MKVESYWFNLIFFNSQIYVHIVHLQNYGKNAFQNDILTRTPERIPVQQG